MSSDAYATFVQGQARLRMLFAAHVDQLIINCLMDTSKDISAKLNDAVKEALEKLQACITAGQQKIKQEVDAADDLENAFSGPLGLHQSADIQEETLKNLEILVNLDKTLFELESSTNNSRSHDENLRACNMKALFQKLGSMYEC
ncbi:hypothetical protein G6F62_009957 [Rhizopus arrhizus]|nr:hypothetical protein G6F62_009957 [Rhizopus arrhizus]